MKVYPVILLILLIPLIIKGAEWESFNLKVAGTGPSAEKGSTKYSITDASGKVFDVNYSTPPADREQKRVIELKDLFYGWENISVKHPEFYFSGEGIYTTMNTERISYKGENLLPYLPAGLAFQDNSQGLHYRFRIVVENRSWMLDGTYTNEEALLQEIYNFIRKKKKDENKEAEEDKDEASITVKSEGKESRSETTVTEDKPEKEKTRHRLSVFAAGNYLLPDGKLEKIFSHGYGGMAGVTLHNTGISLNDKTLFHLDFTFSAGYWQYIEKEGIDSETNCSIESAYIVPLALTARHPFYFFDDFYISPVAGAGLNYNSIDYCEPTVLSDYQKIKIRAWAPSLTGGVQLGYSLVKEKISLIGGVEYTAIFERRMTANSWVFNAGVEYSLMFFSE